MNLANLTVQPHDDSSLFNLNSPLGFSIPMTGLYYTVQHVLIISFLNKSQTLRLQKEYTPNIKTLL